jgi:hypothetical protein
MSYKQYVAKQLESKYATAEATPENINSLYREVDRLTQNRMRAEAAGNYGAMDEIAFEAQVNRTIAERLEKQYAENQKKQEEQLKAEQARIAAEESRLAAQAKAQEEARIKQQEQLSLLGQKDLSGVAREFGTADLGAALELQGQRKENIRKQQQAEKIESLGLKLTSRTQRGRRGTASSATGGRGFFERYFT